MAVEFILASSIFAPTAEFSAFIASTPMPSVSYRSPVSPSRVLKRNLPALLLGVKTQSSLYEMTTSNDELTRKEPICSAGNRKKSPLRMNYGSPNS